MLRPEAVEDSRSLTPRLVPLLGSAGTKFIAKASYESLAVPDSLVLPAFDGGHRRLGV